MADENETKICDAVGLNGTESPAKSPADVLAMSFDRDAFLRTARPSEPFELTPCFVYLMQCERFVKVGIATDPQKRWAGLQGANPFPVRLAGKFRFDDRSYAYLAEQACHRVMAAHRTFGEWFDVPYDSAKAVVRRVVPAARYLAELHRRAVRDKLRADKLRYQQDPEFRAEIDRRDAADRIWLEKNKARMQAYHEADKAFDQAITEDTAA